MVKKQGEDSPIYKYFLEKEKNPTNLFLAIIKLMDLRIVSKTIGKTEVLYTISSDFSYENQECDSIFYCSNFSLWSGGKFKMDIIEINEKYILIKPPPYKFKDGLNPQTGFMEYSNFKNCLLKLTPKPNKIIVELIDGLHNVEINGKRRNNNHGVPAFKIYKKRKDFTIKMVFTKIQT